MKYNKILSLILATLFAHSAFAASLPPVVGKTCMVVTSHRYASEVGLQILRAGGNAIDAAVAIGYTLAVVNPCCGNLGGGGFMLIRFKDGRSTVINFREKAPLLATPEKYQAVTLTKGHVRGEILSEPYLAVGVPGTVMGLNYALKKYGTKSLNDVISPAVRLAREGFVLLPDDMQVFKTSEENFKTQANVASIFLKNNAVYKTGERLVQKNLAATLGQIAQGGTDAFYKGKIAQEIVKASQQNHGLFTLADFSSYRVTELAPISCQYRGLTLITTPPPSSGGPILCEALQILEKYPLQQLGFHSAASSHYVLEAMRYAYLDRFQFLGDPDYVANPAQELLSPAHIEAIRKKIIDVAPPLTPTKLRTPESAHTTSYVVVDKWGNAVSVTYTINDYFGAKVIAGNTGFFLNNEMADFSLDRSEKQNQIAGGKRPLSSMAPTIVTQSGKTVLIMGTPGGKTIPTQLINFVTNLVDYRMDIQAAANAPKFHLQAVPNLVYAEPFAFSKDSQNILEKMGYVFKMGSPFGPPYWGAITAIAIDPHNDKIFGAMDVRRPAGLAIGD